MTMSVGVHMCDDLYDDVALPTKDDKSSDASERTETQQRPDCSHGKARGGSDEGTGKKDARNSDVPCTSKTLQSTMP